MTYRQRFFDALARLVTGRSGLVLLGGVVLTVVMIAAATRLQMKTQIADMMPEGIPQADEYLRIIQNYSSASSVIVAVESRSGDIARMKACADDAARRLEDITRVVPAQGQKLSVFNRLGLSRADIVYDTVPLVRRVDYKVDKEFIERHGMMLQKTKDLGSFQQMFSSLSLADLLRNINDNFEREYVGDAENLTTLDGEGQAVQALEGVARFVRSIDTWLDSPDSAATADAVASFVTGDNYFISSDNTLLMLMVEPSVSLNDFEASIDMGEQIKDTLHSLSSDWPGLFIGATGAVMIQIDENEAIARDFGWSSVISLLLILMLLTGSYRSWRYPFYALVALVTGILWVTGTIALTLRYIDMMSASFGIILIGLGIDFGIHLISGYRDARERGLAPEEAIHDTYAKVASGVVTGGLTTAVVFFALCLVGMKVFTSMGLAVGIGMVVLLAVMMVFVPMLIYRHTQGKSLYGLLFNKGRPLEDITRRETAPGTAAQRLLHAITEPFQFHWLERSGLFIGRLPVAIVVLLAAVALTVWSIVASFGLKFEYDMMELEPVGIPSVITQDKVLDRFEIAPDYSMYIADDLDECRRLVEEIKKVGNRTGLIGQVEAITEFLPDSVQQSANRRLIESFRNDLERTVVPRVISVAEIDSVAAQLERLHQNIVEIGELSIISSGEKSKIVRKTDMIVGSSDDQSTVLAAAEKVRGAAPEALARYQFLAGSVIKERLLHMCSTEYVTLESLPSSLSERFVHPLDGSLLVNVYPKGNIWEEKRLRRFVDVTASVSEKITGMPTLTLMFLDLIREKGILATGIGAVAIVVFLLLDFRSVWYTLAALLPLCMGTAWMLGGMMLLGLKLNMVNFMALPLIVGIGIDDGVHILHRYRLEGRGSVPEVMKYTGRAILLTSLTTSFGFGSMALATHRGIASMGLVLVLGVGSCFLTSAFVLPAILTVVERLTKKAK